MLFIIQLTEQFMKLQDPFFLLHGFSCTDLVSSLKVFRSKNQMLHMDGFEIVKCWNYSLNLQQFADRNLDGADKAIHPHGLNAHTLNHSTSHCQTQLHQYDWVLAFQLTVDW